MPSLSDLRRAGFGARQSKLLLSALGGGAAAKVAWDPQFSTAGGGTVPSIGAGGSKSGWYVDLGPLVIYGFRFVFGSGATPGTGIYAIVPPLPAPASGPGGHGSGVTTNSSGQGIATNYEVYNGWIAGVFGTANGYVGSGSPTGMGSATGTPSINGTVVGLKA